MLMSKKTRGREGVEDVEGLDIAVVVVDEGLVGGKMY